jgi:hypothetical protein
MHNTTLALTILALFTNNDKAAEIEGDLLEQARGKRLWFWWQVKLTCIALFFHNLRAEPAKLPLLGYAVYELMLKFNWWVLTPLRRSLRGGLDLDEAQAIVMNNVIAVQVAFMMGIVLTLLSPKQGAQLTFIAAAFYLGRLVLLEGLADVPRFLAFALVPAVLGVLLMKALELRNGGPFIPQASH